jgi:hypothetical protein
MNNFLGTFANLAGKRIGRFIVTELAGRDTSGAPRWKVVCDECSYPKTLSHSKLAPLVQGRHSQISLLCQNPACPLSHRENQTETLTDIRRQERQAEAKAAEAQREAAANAEKEQKKAVRDDRIRREYLAYLNHQWRVGAADKDICTQKRWFSLSDSSRKHVLDAAEKHPTSPLIF